MNNARQRLFWKASIFSSDMLRLWPVMIVWLAVGAVDIQRRFVSDVITVTSEGMLNETAIEIDERAIGRLDRKLYNSYILKLAQYNEMPESIAIESPESSVEVREPWKGAGFWESADHNYILLAIFGSDERFAVLRRRHRETDAIDLVELRAGDLVDGYAVDQIAVHSVLLSSATTERVELMLFRPLAIEDSLLDFDQQF